MKKGILIISTLLIAMLVFGCTENGDQIQGNFLGRGGGDRNFPNRDGNFVRGGMPQDGNFAMGALPLQMQQNIAITLGLVKDASIIEIKLYLGLQESSTNEELMQALKDKNIFGGRYR